MFSQFTSACVTSNCNIVCENPGTLKLLIYLSSYLDQETAKRSFRSSSPVTCYYHSNF